MRVLVTGASGFVGHHLVAALRARGDEVVAAGRGGDDPRFLPLDLADPDNLRAVLDIAEPAAIFHLAAQTFVPASFASPLPTYDTNILGTARLLDAVRGWAQAAGRMPRVLIASSAEVYGTRPPADYPLRETLAPRPLTPYGASKAAAELVALAAGVQWRVPAIVTRAFNHIGPGQDARFAVASFAAQLARIAAGGERVLLVGNLDAERDFLDVRDVVAAYLAIVEAGVPGEIYNVCSGTPVRLREALRILVGVARVAVEIREDPARMRPADVPISFGDAAKLRAATGWLPQFTLERTLRDVYDDARVRVEAP